MNVKKLARKRGKERKRLGRYQIFFHRMFPFFPTRRLFPTSLVVSDNVTSCSKVFHQLYLTMEVTYCGISYVVSGHSLHFIRYGVVVWHFTGGMRSHYSSSLHTLFSVFLLTFLRDLEHDFGKCCWNMFPIYNNHQFFQLKWHWMHSKCE